MEYDEPVLATNQIKGTKQENGYTTTFQNTGRVFATNVRLEFKAQINDSGPERNFPNSRLSKDATLISESIGDLAPDDITNGFFWPLVLKEPPTVTSAKIG